MVYGLFLKVLYQLSLMRSAVGLLALCALASMVGTVLPQGLPIQGYVVEFGPFWARVLWHSGLTDVFRAWWFLAILSVMMASVAACLWRNGPLIYKQIYLPKTVPQAANTVRFAAKETVFLPLFADLGLRRVGRVQGYDVWQRGALNRVGYFCVHIGVLGVALAGLVTGLVGWRGTLNLREGETDNVALVWHGAEATPQFLPFTVTNQLFEIEHYPTGMPKRYVTTLRFEGKERDLTALPWSDSLRSPPGRSKTNGSLSSYAEAEAAATRESGVVKMVEVNSPVGYGAYTFYQASFGDGGSLVRGVGVNMAQGSYAPFEGHVYDKAHLPDGTRVELLEFRPFTVETLPGVRPTDVGPSMDYLVQPPAAPARQLRAYLNHPEIIGVAEGERAVGDGKVVVYRPVLLGVKDTQLWPLVARVAQGEDYRQVVAPLLRQIPDAQARVEAGLAVMQAAKLVRELDISHLIILRDFELRRYSGLQVAYDPAVNFFWFSSALLLVGVVLMLGRRMVRVFVKDGDVLVTSPHGRAYAEEVALEINKERGTR